MRFPARSEEVTLSPRATGPAVQACADWVGNRKLGPAEIGSWVQLQNSQFCHTEYDKLDFVPSFALRVGRRQELGLAREQNEERAVLLP